TDERAAAEAVEDEDGDDGADGVGGREADAEDAGEEGAGDYHVQGADAVGCVAWDDLDGCQWESAADDRGGVGLTRPKVLAALMIESM
ncbi:hypothetical protein LTR48_008311, partial [Friedmanniomyces endolithicus]